MSRFRRRISIDFAAINREALPLLPAILQRLLPNGRREGHEYVALNPRRGDRQLGSFKINLRTGDGPTSRATTRAVIPSRWSHSSKTASRARPRRKLARMLGLDAGGRRHG